MTNLLGGVQFLCDVGRCSKFHQHIYIIFIKWSIYLSWGLILGSWLLCGRRICCCIIIFIICVLNWLAWYFTPTSFNGCCYYVMVSWQSVLLVFIGWWVGRVWRLTKPQPSSVCRRQLRESGPGRWGCGHVDGAPRWRLLLRWLSTRWRARVDVELELPFLCFHGLVDTICSTRPWPLSVTWGFVCTSPFWCIFLLLFIITTLLWECSNKIETI